MKPEKKNNRFFIARLVAPTNWAHGEFKISIKKTWAHTTILEQISIHTFPVHYQMI